MKARLVRSSLVAVVVLSLVATLTAVSSAASQSVAPTRPSGLQATLVAHDSVSLAWDDPGDTTITHYEVLRRDRDLDAAGVFETITDNTESADASYTDTTVAPSKRYVYRVVAVNSVDGSPRSGYVNVDTPAPPVPERPSGLAVTSVAHDSVSLAWDDPGDTTITHYEVLRRDRDLDAAGVFETITEDTGTADASYTDASTQPTRRYVYRVVAVNAEGKSPRSSYVDVDTPEEPEESVVIIEVPSDSTSETQRSDKEEEEESSAGPRQNDPTDAALGALTLTGATLNEVFAADNLVYTADADAGTVQVTIVAAPQSTGATIVYSPDDAKTGVDGYQIYLGEPKPGGQSTETNVSITVRSQDDTTMLSYAVTITRAAPAAATGCSDVVTGIGRGNSFVRNSSLDLDLISMGAPIGDARLAGIWSDCANWYFLVDNDSSRATNGERVLAYDYATKERRSELDFSISAVSPVNWKPRSLWSNGVTFRIPGRGLGAAEVRETGRHPNQVFAYSAVLGDDYGAFLGHGDRFMLEGVNTHNRTIEGFWSDGEVFWITWRSHQWVMAYDYDTGERLRDLDFDLSELPPGRVGSPLGPSISGLWSDGYTMWVADVPADRVLAFDLFSRERQPALDINGGLRQLGFHHTADLWSNGETMWVSNLANPIAVAFDMPKRIRLESATVSGADLQRRSVNLFDGHVARGTEQVSVSAVPAVAGHSMSFSVADADLVAEGHQWDLSLGDNTLVITVSDGRASERFTVSVRRVDAGALSDDASLSSLKVDATAVEASAADSTRYWSAVPNNTAMVTVAAVATESAAQVVIEPADADAAEGHQVTLVEGFNDVTVTVAASDGKAETLYQLRIRRKSPALARAEYLELGEMRADRQPSDVWSDGTTWWVSYSASRYIRVSDVADGNPDLDKSIEAVETNANPVGMWSSGTSLLVADGATSDVFTYSLAEETYGDHLSTSGLAGIADDNLRGVWSSGEVLYAVDATNTSVLAYNAETLARVATSDIALATDNAKPQDLWSSGTVMWVLDSDDERIYAYDVSSKERQQHMEIPSLDDENSEPTGIFSDGDTMWVTDRDQDHSFAYVIPAPDPPELSTVSGAGVERVGFRRYFSRVPRGSSQVTMAAVPVDDGDTITFGTADADGMVDGHQWDLSLGDNTLMITVADPVDSSDASIYTVEVTRLDVVELSSDSSLSSLSVDGTALSGFSSTKFDYTLESPGATAATVLAAASHADASVTVTPADSDPADGHQVSLDSPTTVVTVTVVSSDTTTPSTYSVTISNDAATAEQTAGSDVDLATGHDDPLGVWSNGTTVWIADNSDDKVYAYTLATGARDSAKDIDTLKDAGNTDPSSLWSNGTTMWVTDVDDYQLYAYTLAGGARDDTKDIDIVFGSPASIWSDGTTMWVGHVGGRIHAYTLTTGDRDHSKDIDTLLAAGNIWPSGMWSDNTTLWVVDYFDRRVYAYDLATGNPTPALNVKYLQRFGNMAPTGLWSNGTTMWVADYAADKLFAFQLSQTGN